MKYFHFEILHQSRISRARVGKIHTPHGTIDTPNFVAVGTHAALKALDAHSAQSIDMQLMFCNTYHLMVHPGTDVVQKAGGLHNFMQRHKPIITDSGGFQVFSLAYGTVHDELKSKGSKKQNGSVVKISEEGVLFRSYRDGNQLLLTPESSIKAQKELGADIIIPFDELPPYHIDHDQLQKSVARTHRWEKRSLDAHLQQPNNQAMYSVIHGGIDPQLRTQSAHYLRSLSFDGHAIGGSVGKNRQEMATMLTHVMPLLPTTHPAHLLGIGDLPSIDTAVRLGIDTFDSSYPTRCARHGLLLSSTGNINIVQGKYAKDFAPLDAHCTCLVCTHYTRAYIHHLFKAKELSAYTLATIHNLSFMVLLMQQYRTMIIQNKI